MKKLLLTLVFLLAGLASYLLLWPVPIQAQAWVAPNAPGYVGPHAPNTRLAGLQMISLGAEEGPEHVALGPDGWLYTAVSSGKLLRMKPDGSERSVWAQTGGRVLGFDFDAQGRMIAADAMRGLLAISRIAPTPAPLDTPARAGFICQQTLAPLVIARDSARRLWQPCGRFGPAPCPSNNTP
ncbi:MAG: hypothetical protein C4K60_00220 [Ideonella sp. MAG2]|nr:MAG: hypothetical protein C4K60_00220 [Ideonella sp. MAG2]